MVDSALFAEIRTALAPVSESYLRDLLRGSGAVLDPLVEGVRQHDYRELERTLLALESLYAAARAAQDRATMHACRRQVIEAKEHARWAARRAADASKRAQKEEMMQWMLVWLESPDMFPAWLVLRKRALTGSRSSPPE